ncbi:MAG: MATE family efflux transporter [Halobacteriaceae archaeon]
MLALAWPIVVFQLLQVAYNVADTIYLGWFDTDAVGALSIAFPLIFFLISIGGGFTTAGAILVAQYTGANSEGSAGRVAGQTLWFVTALATLLGVLGFFLTDTLLGLIPADPETARLIIPLAADYMRIFFLGMPFLFGFFVFSALLRGYGNTRTPMRVMALSVAVNVVLDPLLIFGVGPIPTLGIEGAALATIASRGLATAVGLYVLLGTDAGPAVSVADFRPDPPLLEKIVRVGLPSAAEQSMSSIALITLTGMVATFGPAVVTAYGLGNRIVSLVFLPALGLGRATNTMVGQNLGAKRPDRAESAVRLAAGVAAGVLFVVAVIAALFPGRIVSVFIGTGTEKATNVIALGSEYLRIRAVEFVFLGVMQVLLGAFRGAGDTKTALAFSAVTLWVARVPLVFFLALETTVTLTVGGEVVRLFGHPLTVTTIGMGPAGIWWGMAAGNVLGAVAAGAWFTRGTWKQAVVEDTPTPE